MINYPLMTAETLLLLGIAFGVSANESTFSGVELWGYRKALPAVVNQVTRSPMQATLSLRGEWEFVTQAANIRPQRHPGWDRFFSKPWTGVRTLQVPGCWEAQGVGEPGMGNSWDCKWDHCAKPLRHIFEGEGWYRKTVDIPATWQDKRVWLKIGGVRSQGWFWVNNKTVAWVDNYCGTYKYDITDLVQPGRQAVVVAAVNSVVPSRKGLFSSVHRFGGLYRDVEIEATPDTRIDDAWVRGDFDQQTAEVHTVVAYATEAGRLKNPVVRVSIQSAVGTRQSAAGHATITFSRAAKARMLFAGSGSTPSMPGRRNTRICMWRRSRCATATDRCMAGPNASACARSRRAATAFS